MRSSLSRSWRMGQCACVRCLCVCVCVCVCVRVHVPACTRVCRHARRALWQKLFVQRGVHQEWGKCAESCHATAFHEAWASGQATVRVPHDTRT